MSITLLVSLVKENVTRDNELECDYTLYLAMPGKVPQINSVHVATTSAGVPFRNKMTIKNMAIKLFPEYFPKYDGCYYFGLNRITPETTLFQLVSKTDHFFEFHK